MNRLITYVLLTATAGGLVSCLSQKPVYMEYNLDDVPFRNLTLNFYKDSSYILVNQKEGNVFSSGGNWKLIDKHTYLMINPYCLEQNCDTVNRALAPSEKVNYDLFRELGTKYIFPMIEKDTVRFSIDFRSVVLKGYRFRGYKRP